MKNPLSEQYKKLSKAYRDLRVSLINKTIVFTENNEDQDMRQGYLEVVADVNIEPNENDQLPENIVILSYNRSDMIYTQRFFPLDGDDFPFVVLN
jgi:hypothetical protein